MDVADESLAELFEQYKDEVRESIGTLDTELVAIEQDPTNSEVIFSIFRHLHSLKGSSKMFNVDNIGHIAHKLEDLMQLIDQDNSILGRHPKIVEILFRGNDIFREIIARLEEDIGFVNLTREHAAFIEDISHQVELLDRKEGELISAAQSLIDEVESLLTQIEEQDTEALKRAMANLAAQVSRATLAEGGAQLRYIYGGKDISAQVIGIESALELFRGGQTDPESVRAFLTTIEELASILFEVAQEEIMGVLAELNDGLTMFKEHDLEIDAMVVEFFAMILTDLKEHFHTEAAVAVPESKVQGPDEELPAVSRTAAPAPTQAKTIRVDERKIDQFLDSVGKLITQSEILNHLQYSFKVAGINPSLVRDFAAVNRTISADIVGLQRSIMEVRQVEMDNILKKFPRLVRDVSHKMGKEAELVITGERVPIDKSLLDDVEQAMIHIVRNAIDHGLERPDEREQTGKSPRGRIAIKVVQEEASILIEVTDDGRGVDFSRVRERALERGLIDREECETMSDQESKALLFRSGLTTKEEATDISGRGVGLDVVQSNIRKWNGDVQLESVPGQGMTISLRIPITNTLLTKEAILLKLGPTTFCLPLESIVEIVTVPASEIHRHKAQSIFQHRNKVIAVVDIKNFLGMPPTAADSQDTRTFIILRGSVSHHKAIGADEIVGQQKIVIKDFEMEAFRRLPYIQGLTLLGDGRVVLVLNAEEIVD